MPKQVPCPNPDCENGYIRADVKEDNLTPPKAKCPTCKGTEWVFREETDQTDEDQT